MCVNLHTLQVKSLDKPVSSLSLPLHTYILKTSNKAQDVWIQPIYF